MKTVLTAADWAALQEIVNHAADLDIHRQSEYLDEACHGQPELRARADSLLRALATDSGTLFSPAIEEAASLVVDQQLPANGSRIGAYRIESVIGRGGMGVVYEASRDDDQYQKRVAIKVVASGLLSRTLLQRFRTERQILANLDHPGIARLLDGGTTDSGLPYVVMELVQGVPLDQYCGTLNLKEKLRLFVQVARAVQYAHRNLVVHRDLKPANVLVTMDGQPKLLDFGIAKLLELDATDQRLTADLGRIMTPSYASPEQVRGEAIGTATDVYQLGVVLYELLTGRLPFTTSTNLFELEQTVCHKQPDKPDVNADLDRIILKALEKEPGARYGSAGEFAADIERYLGGFPVEARPPSWAYKTSRFVRRHWLGSAAVLLFVIIITAGIIGLAKLTRRAQTEAKISDQVTDFLVGLFVSNEPRNGRGDQVTARELLDRGVPKLNASLKDAPEVRARLLDTMGSIYTHLGDLKEARRLLSEALSVRRNVLRREDDALAGTIAALGDNAADMGQLQEAENLYREAVRISRKVLGPNDDLVAGGISNLSSVLYEQGKLKEAEALNAEAVEMRKRILGPDAVDTLVTMNNLQTVYTKEGKYEQAEKLAREVLERRQKFEGEFHFDLAYSWGNLASVLSHLAKHDEAVKAARKSLEIRLKVFQGEHTQIQWGRITLADVLTEAGSSEEALTVAKKAVDELTRSLGLEHTTTAFAMQALGTAELDDGKIADARKHLASALATREKLLPPLSTLIAGNVLELSEADLALGDVDRAAREAERAARLYRSAFGEPNIFEAQATTVQAEIEAEKKNWERVRALSEQAVQVLLANLPAHHPVTARANAATGWALINLGKSTEGDALLREAADDFKTAYGGTAPPASAVRLLARWRVSERPALPAR